MSKNNDNTLPHKRKFKHLTIVERVRIETFNDLGYGVNAIARELEVSSSTISYELKRGTVEQIGIRGKKFQKYFASAGQADYEKQRKNSVARGLEKYCSHFFQKLSKSLKKKHRTHSVDTFVVYYAVRYPERRIPSTKTVYNLIEEGKLAQFNILNIDLPRKTSLRSKKDKPSVPKGTNKKELGKSIDKRPTSVLERAEFGHWEIDFVKGSKEQGEPALLTLVERMTRYGQIRKVVNFEAKTCLEALTEVIKEIGVNLFKSLTFDNGSEFSLASELESLSTSENELSVFFAHAYSSWERGSNENFNGLLREFVPKGESIHNYSDEDIIAFEEALNKRPRKILGYQTAEETFDMAMWQAA